MRTTAFQPRRFENHSGFDRYNRTNRDFSPKAASHPPASNGNEVYNHAGESFSDFPGREGYDENFLGAKLPLPQPDASIADRVAHLTKDPSKTELEYTHYSVIQDKERRCPMITAANVDGSQYFEIERDGSWVFDGRIPREYQLGNEAYKNNPIDKGHMTRRKDPMWGDQQTASRGSADTFVYTNCALQHSELNQHEWLDLENFILNRAVENKQKVSVFTGPVLNENDPSFNNKGKVSPPTQMPMAFWKVAVWNEPGQGLKGEAYVMSQKDIIGHGDAQPTDFHMTKAEEFAKYRVSLQDLEKMTSIHFGPIKNA